MKGAIIPVVAVVLVLAFVATYQPRVIDDISTQSEEARHQLASAQTQVANAKQREVKATAQVVASATLEAKQTAAAIAAQTATVSAYHFALEQTATAEAKLTVVAIARATASAAAIQADLELSRAQAEKERIARDSAQAAVDAERWAGVQEKLTVVVLIFGALVTVAVAAIVVAIVWVSIAALFGLVERMQLTNARIAAQNTLFQVQGGAVVSVNAKPMVNGLRHTRVIIPPSRLAPPSRGEAIPIGVIPVRQAGRTVGVSRITDKEALAMDSAFAEIEELLVASMAHVGEDGARIPSARILGWSASKRDRVVKFMGDRIITREGGGQMAGTFCANPPTLLEMAEAYRQRRVYPVLPTPAVQVGVAP